MLKPKRGYITSLKLGAFHRRFLGGRRGGWGARWPDYYTTRPLVSRLQVSYSPMHFRNHVRRQRRCYAAVQPKVISGVQRGLLDLDVNSHFSFGLVAQGFPVLIDNTQGSLNGKEARVCPRRPLPQNNR